MNTDLHHKIQHAGWNRAAPYYDQLWQDSLRPAHEALLSMVLPAAGSRIVDICAGSGLFTSLLARRSGKECNVLGTDFSEYMIEIARKNYCNGVDGQLNFDIMDAERLNIPDRQFDLAVNALGLMYLADPFKALAEMQRVLKPGGKAAALVWGNRENCGWSDIFPIVDKRVSTEVCPLFFQMGTGDILVRSFRKAGFSVDQERRITYHLKFENEEEASQAMFLGGPVALAWKHFGRQDREESRREYLDSIARFKSNSGYEIPGEFVLVTGIRPKSDSVTS